MGFVALFVGGVVLIGVLVHYAQEPCPQCGKRWTLRWLNQRKDGKPDLRFKENYRLCPPCGWTSK